MNIVERVGITMLKENNQLSFCLSSHSPLYDILIEKNKIIEDSTHMNAMYDKMPKKRENRGLLEDQIEYTKELLNLLKEDVHIKHIDYMETEELEKLFSNPLFFARPTRLLFQQSRKCGLFFCIKTLFL